MPFRPLEGEFYNIVLREKLPKQLGGGRVSVELGVYYIGPRNLMMQILDNGQFTGELLPVPRKRNYRFKLVSLADVGLAEPLEFEEWLEFMKSKELTIADIEAMQPGEQLKVIQLHRNLGDYVLNEYVNPYDTAISAVEFFAPVGGLYTHSHDLHGRLLDVPDDCDCGESEFNFHLNYQGTHWYPLGDDGLLPVATGEYMIRHAVADYRAYPKSTKVGMRGPMLRLSDVEKAPPLYHREISYI